MRIAFQHALITLNPSSLLRNDSNAITESDFKFKEDDAEVDEEEIVAPVSAPNAISMIDKTVKNSGPLACTANGTSRIDARRSIVYNTGEPLS